MKDQVLQVQEDIHLFRMQTDIYVSCLMKYNSKIALIKERSLDPSRIIEITAE